MSVVVLALLALAALAALACLARQVLDFLRVRRMTATLPGPPGWPLIGILPYFLCPMDELYDRVARLCRDYGPVFRMWIGHITLVVVADPDDLEAVLSNQEVIDVPPLYGPTQQMLGTGLPFTSGDAWRRRRHALDPVMHLEVLKGFVPSFHRKALELVEKLARLADEGATFDVDPLCRECSNNSICETIMSTEVDEDDPGRQRFLRAVPRALYHAIYRTCRPWLLSEWLYSFTGNYADYIQVKKDLNFFTRNIIRTKKEKLSRQKEEPPGPAGTGRRQHQAFLDHFLSSEAGDSLSESELADEVKTLVFIGSGSSVDAFVFTLYVLAVRQDIQDRVKQELDEIFEGARHPTIEASAVQRMRYLECVIREVLRYFSVAPFFGRTCPRDTRLPSSGALLPRGCHLMFWTPYVHMDPRWFPEPRRFDPERFLPERSAGRHPFATLSFGGGARSCLGQRYALLFLKTAVATLVSRLRFVLPDDAPAAARRLEDLRLKLTITVSMRDGARLRALRR